MITAQEASDYGLVSRVVPDADGAPPSSGVLEAALKLAEDIASKGRLASIAAKEAVNTGACPRARCPSLRRLLLPVWGRAR